MQAGKPQNQSIAIALSEARKSRRRKMAYGGEAQEENLAYPRHQDSAGEPHTDGLYEDRDPMEPVPGHEFSHDEGPSGEAGQYADPDKKRDQDKPKFYAGGEVDREAKHREPKHFEESPQMYMGGQVDRSADYHEDREFSEEPHLAFGGKIDAVVHNEERPAMIREKKFRGASNKSAFASALKKKYGF